ncbi:hypothetical protein L917_00277, partial [Phytophthora nicotianae]
TRTYLRSASTFCVSSAKTSTRLAPQWFNAPSSIRPSCSHFTPKIYCRLRTSLVAPNRYIWLQAPSDN